jgi:hypothetical protein
LFSDSLETVIAAFWERPTSNMSFRI